MPRPSQRPATLQACNFFLLLFEPCCLLEDFVGCTRYFQQYNLGREQLEGSSYNHGVRHVSAENRPLGISFAISIAMPIVLLRQRFAGPDESDLFSSPVFLRPFRVRRSR
ncbi:hypothetical protein KSP39_PZI007443 [Platanthera zijinensis]|uniref:Secreted protein n=1 Tax=Platanthera zijinensis TaxID=2320716 RepID=A0AAP0BR55_9ASPA